jgi:hypothetical protein
MQEVYMGESMKIEDVRGFRDTRFLRHLCEILHHLEFYDLVGNFCHKGLHHGVYTMTRQEVEDYEWEMREWYQQLEKEKENSKGGRRQ